MIKSILDPDEVLTKLASDAVKQSENLRETVRDITLRALQTRELGLAQIKQIIRSVTEGINQGVAKKAKGDVALPLEEAFAGMDDALLQGVQACDLALRQLATQRKDFQQSYLKKALDDLEHWEDELLSTVKQTSEGATAAIQAQWEPVLSKIRLSGTETGAQAADTMQRFATEMKSAVRQTRASNLKAASLLVENFTTLASGVLIGLSQGLQNKRPQ